MQPRSTASYVFLSEVLWWKTWRSIGGWVSDFSRKVLVLTFLKVLARFLACMIHPTIVFDFPMLFSRRPSVKGKFLYCSRLHGATMLFRDASKFSSPIFGQPSMEPRKDLWLAYNDLRLAPTLFLASFEASPHYFRREAPKIFDLQFFLSVVNTISGAKRRKFLTYNSFYL